MRRQGWEGHRSKKLALPRTLSIETKVVLRGRGRIRRRGLAGAACPLLHRSMFLNRHGDGGTVGHHHRARAQHLDIDPPLFRPDAVQPQAMRASWQEQPLT